MTPEKQLAAFMAKFTPEVEALAEAALAKMRARFPNAIQMVYDNYNFLVIGFGPTERASEAIFSIALFARGVNLFFLQAASKLPDPKRLLNGSGKHARHIRLENAAVLDRPAVKALMSQAIKRAAVSFDATAPGRLIIKSISAKQRPRGLRVGQRPVLLGLRRSTAQRRGAQRGADRGRVGEEISVTTDVSPL